MHSSALRAPPLPSYTTGQARRGGGLYCFCLSPFTKGEISFLNLSPSLRGRLRGGVFF